jgi:hypothetical protein
MRATGVRHGSSSVCRVDSVFDGFGGEPGKKEFSFQQVRSVKIPILKNPDSRRNP